VEVSCEGGDEPSGVGGMDLVSQSVSQSVIYLVS
jgi:hypothetical protein